MVQRRRRLLIIWLNIYRGTNPAAPQQLTRGF
jgi:hypothetical protein